MADLFSIESVILHRLNMKLKAPFTTSLDHFQNKDFYIIEVIDQDGNQGFGETVAFPTPWYTEETTETVFHMMDSFLIPLLQKKQLSHPDQVAELFMPIRRNNMAKAGLEGAIWDLYAKRQAIPLADAIGGDNKKPVEVGVAVGIQESLSDLLKVVEQHVTEGYKRIKLKIKPGKDLTILKEVRKQFPDIPLMADANSAYSLKDLDHLKRFDELGLQMIEQPLGHNDFLDHAMLQRQIETPICLDESIHTLSDVKTAIALGSCKIITIKLGRVGGYTVAKKIHDYCREHDVPVWCGGMLEAGIGRAHSIALATLPQFILPGDTSASSRYWEKDIITPEVTMHNGLVQLPDLAGIGFEIDWQALESYRIQKIEYK
ncbi:o-succinylbenzoate synthase [Aquibacillus kalidii]|uniref:o-succinylbenzoate synthase n=1 Tax=Aquibacillus kalidii TaxID=2762597 RepID=UPI0016473634|nr:o-succinylbenzoate synthase [Aquibacillus kalidii]